MITRKPNLDVSPVLPREPRVDPVVAIAVAAYVAAVIYYLAVGV